MKSGYLKHISRYIPLALVGLRFAFAFLILAAAYFMKAEAAIICTVFIDVYKRQRLYWGKNEICFITWIAADRLTKQKIG